MTTGGFRRKEYSWPLGLAPAVVLGLGLRLYLLPGQILVDDEWHALNFVADKSPLSLFLRQGGGATCIPQNIYSAALLRTVGWSEMLLRLPSIVCGAAALFVLPLMIRRLWNGRVALIFAYLLAISPCVVFFSRFCRPYEMVMFFGMVSLLSAFLWIRQDCRSHMVAYSISAFIAVYFHLYATLFVIPPILCLFALRVLKDRGYVKTAIPSYKRILQAAGIFSLLTALFVVPPNLLNHWWLGRGFHGEEGASLHTILNLSSLLSGTHVPALQILFMACVVPGLYLLLRDDFPIGVIILAALICFSVKIGLSEQVGINVAIQVARYGIILFPIAFLLAAIFMARAVDKLAGVYQAAAIAGFTCLFFFFGPIRSVYRSPNNFTNHSAYQNEYTPTDWSLSREREFTKGLVMKKENIPAAYLAAVSAADTAGVIEYPMMVGDDLDLYYYYQLFHRKPVAIGYLADVQYSPLDSGDDYVYGSTSVGYVLNRIPPDLAGNLHFKNIVALGDIGRLKHFFRGWNIVIHRQLLAEVFPERIKMTPKTNAYVEGALRRLNDSGIPTVHQDDRLTILRIP